MNLNETNVSEYGKDTNENAMKKLYFKVYDVIKDAKMQKLAVDSCNIKAEGISFIGNFTGKNTLQLERIKNVKLKIELLQSKKVRPQSEYDTKDMMADIYACAISDLGGNFTYAMRSTYEEIKTKFGHEDITDEKMYELAARKVTQGQSYLPVIHKEKSLGAIFGDIKTQIEYFRLENKKLENEIILERGKSQFGTFDYVGKNAGIIIPTNVKNAKKALTN
ncbi:MAG: hypothetical protein IKJ36_01205 [Clostridia bacterium]|nr:hypothetical protein [Clostridia bacterium]